MNPISPKPAGGMPPAQPVYTLSGAYRRLNPNATFVTEFPIKIIPSPLANSITAKTLEQAVSAWQVAIGKRISSMIEKVIHDLSKLQKFEGKAEVIDRLRTELESHFSRELAGNALEGGTKAIMSRMECHALRLLRNMELIIEEVPAPFSETPAG